MMSRKAQKTYSAPAVEKALDVLELLSERSVSMSQADIARALNRANSEIFRTLSVLASRNYVRRTEGGRYRLTLKLFELSRTHSPYEELLRSSSPIMKSLSERVGETCHLSLLEGRSVLVISQHESPKAIRLSVEVGSRHSPLSTTSGRVMLASMGEDQLEEYLAELPEYRAWSDQEARAFRARLGVIRSRGYEIADGERFLGGLDVGVLVGSTESTIRAALVIATLRNNDGPDVDRISGPLIEAGKILTATNGLGAAERLNSAD